jgi:hypothetical protein
MNDYLKVLKPKGLAVNSQGRKPLVNSASRNQSPNGATVLSPRWGFQLLLDHRPGAYAPGYLLSPPWGSI